jgi:voltage-gated potassium channel
MHLFTTRSEASEQNFRFLILLLTLVAMLLVPTYFDDEEFLQHIWRVSISLVMLAALYSLVDKGRVALLWLLLLLVPSFLTNWLGLYMDTRWVVLSDNLSTILYFSLVGYYLARFIMRATVVTSNAIYAALCLYMILAIIWAAIYNLHFVYFDTSFAFSHESVAYLAENPETTFSLFNYYSFVTLTTLGYGDIVPLTNTTQAWVAVEAMVGQFYIAIVIARLISSYSNGQPE